MKTFLKAIFSRVFLKRVFLFYNRIKRNSWDRIFYRTIYLTADDFFIQGQKNPFLELIPDTSMFDTEVRRKLELWNNPAWTQDEYILDFEREGFIEGKTGWGVTMSYQLIYPSLGFSSAPHVHKPDLLGMYSSRKRVTKLEAVVSLRDTGEENYFHFYNDVLAKIFFLRDKGFDLHRLVFVIGTKLFNKPYFQFYLSNTFLKDLTFHVQSESEWVQFRKAIFCKPYTHTLKYLTPAIAAALAVATTSPQEKNIFLNRSRVSLRYIENLEEIRPILEKYNFEIVDSADLSFTDQVGYFSTCRNLISVHGAGLTNMIFRKGSGMSILEIVHPSPYVPFHYIMLAELFGFGYDVMLGKKGKDSGSGGFVVDIREFERKVENLMQSNDR